MNNETRLTSWLKALGEKHELEVPAGNGAWVPTADCPPLPRLLDALVKRNWSPEESAHRKSCPYCCNKRVALLALATRRKATRWDRYNCIGDYHGGIFECEFVSPYTKSACNVDAEVMVLLQDWSSHDVLSQPPVREGLELGHDPSRKTNWRLKELLPEHFHLTLDQVYATNVFPFVKGGGISNEIRWPDLVRAAREFAIPQIDIIQPRLAVCLGQATYDALAVACGHRRSSSIAQAIASCPFQIGRTAVWCQRHPAGRHSPNREREEWRRMVFTPAPEAIVAADGLQGSGSSEDLNGLTAERPSAGRKVPVARLPSGADPLGCSGHLQTQVDRYLVVCCRGPENAQTPEDIAKGAGVADVADVKLHLRYWTVDVFAKPREVEKRERWEAKGLVKPFRFLARTEAGKYYVSGNAPQLS